MFKVLYSGFTGLLHVRADPLSLVSLVLGILARGVYAIWPYRFSPLGAQAAYGDTALASIHRRREVST